MCIRDSWHRSFHKVESTSNTMFFQCSCYMSPDLAKVFFAVLGEEGGKTALFQKVMRVIFLCKLVNFPMINIISIPCCCKDLNTYAYPCESACFYSRAHHPPCLLTWTIKCNEYKLIWLRECPPFLLKPRVNCCLVCLYQQGMCH